MLVVLPVCQKDKDAALRNLAWVERLDGQLPFPVLVTHDTETDASAVVAAAQRCFGSVQTFCYPPPRTPGWPAAANWAWQRSAAYVHTQMPQPWLWWEQDAVPLKKGWLLDIAADYTRCGKVFMGASHTTEHGPHLNGVAVYPSDVIVRFPDMALAVRGPFDVVGGGPLLAQAYISPLFQHVWSWDNATNGAPPPTFTTSTDLDRIKPEAVLFHRCKDDSLVKLLTEGLNKPRASTNPLGKMVRAILHRRGPKVIHVVERHQPEDARVRRAIQSWKGLTEAGATTLEVSSYPRSSLAMGDQRSLPYLKDLLLLAMVQAGSSDVVMLTNGDNTLHPQVVEMVRAALKKQPCICSFRLNVTSPPDLSRTPEELAKTGKSDFGRDLFAFRKSWLEKRWNEIPDFLLGEWEWDLILALLIRREAGVETKETGDLQHWQEGCEIPLGYVFHEIHARVWMSKAALKMPGKWHNQKLAKNWYYEHQLSHFYTLG